MAVLDTFTTVANGDQLDDGYFNGILSTTNALDAQFDLLTGWTLIASSDHTGADTSTMDVSGLAAHNQYLILGYIENRRTAGTDAIQFYLNNNTTASVYNYLKVQSTPTWSIVSNSSGDGMFAFSFPAASASVGTRVPVHIFIQGVGPGKSSGTVGVFNMLNLPGETTGAFVSGTYTVGSTDQVSRVTFEGNSGQFRGKLRIFGRTI